MVRWSALGIRSALCRLPNLPFNRVGLLDVSSGTQKAVAGSPERPDVKNPLGVSQHPPPVPLNGSRGHVRIEHEQSTRAHEHVNMNVRAAWRAAPGVMPALTGTSPQGQQSARHSRRRCARDGHFALSHVHMPNTYNGRRPPRGPPGLNALFGAGLRSTGGA